MFRRCLIIGVVTLAHWLAAATTGFAEEKVFKHPKFDGNRLDWCFTFQKGCGKQAANAWCTHSGYKNATSFSKAENVGLTRTIGDSSLCADSNCDSFLQITCVKSTDTAELKYEAPQFKGKRLDWCFAWKEQCGKPAADAFCQDKGHGGAKSFKKEADVPFQTRLISNSQVCDANCDSFAHIVCQ